uniref:Gly-zipper_Omp domain-containing protein n=1 Tax=Panagrellus redivivus TaxID=6233 RepID=A0A7E4V682_PANRE
MHRNDRRTYVVAWSVEAERPLFPPKGPACIEESELSGTTGFGFGFGFGAALGAALGVGLGAGFGAGGGAGLATFFLDSAR